ncbi:hypothetical protein [Bacillus solimangrovi]|uniref:hypothetical protein n=1 Tax=Bacillus solimangrovi TaxID=1305675 RepID=UPI00158682A7|nr:hypothetical protein [Bacillus solimangrovi]
MLSSSPLYASADLNINVVGRYEVKLPKGSLIITSCRKTEEKIIDQKNEIEKEKIGD